MKIFLVIAAVLSAAVNIYCWRCTHYWQSPLRRSRRAGFREKDVSLPDGSVLHYAEGPDNGPALLLRRGI